jgi:RNA polymerase sigma factor (sigma-70 family)
MNKTDKDEKDEQLKQLALIAQQHPPLTSGRQLALRQLVNEILQSGRLCRPQSGQFLGIYQDIYDDALQELLLYICQNIEKYDPERATVMGWVNMLLERRFFKEAIPKHLEQRTIKRMNLSDLDQFVSSHKDESLTEIIKECIELDSDNLFKKETITNYPLANFQTIAMQRFSGKSWKEIAEELNLKVSTVSSFYSRCINKFSPYIRKYSN